MTINGSWGYRSDDVNWKSAQQLIRTCPTSPARMAIIS